MNEMTAISSDVRRTQHFIDGAWVGGEATFPDTDPFDGSLVAEVAAGGRAEAEAAVAAAAPRLPGMGGVSAGRAPAAVPQGGRHHRAAIGRGVRDHGARGRREPRLRRVPGQAVGRDAAPGGQLGLSALRRHDEERRARPDRARRTQATGCRRRLHPVERGLLSRVAHLPAADGLRQHHRDQAVGGSADLRRTVPRRNPRGGGLPRRQLQRRHPRAGRRGGGRRRVLRAPRRALHQLHRVGQDRAHSRGPRGAGVETDGHGTRRLQPDDHLGRRRPRRGGQGGHLRGVSSTRARCA